MSADDPSIVHTIHTWWSALLSGFGGVLFWNWKRMADDVKGKAEKEDVTALRGDIKSLTERIDRVLERL